MRSYFGQVLRQCPLQLRNKKHFSLCSPAHRNTTKGASLSGCFPLLKLLLQLIAFQTLDSRNVCVCYVWPRPSSNRTNSALGNLQSSNPLKLSRKDGAAKRTETAREQQTEQKGDVPIQEFCNCSGSPDWSAMDFFPCVKRRH